MEPLWNVKQVSAYLGVSVDTVYLMRLRGDLPGLTVAGTVRFRPETVRAWTAERETREGARAKEPTRRHRRVG